MKEHELKVGMKVRGTYYGISYTGTVARIYENGFGVRAEIARDGHVTWEIKLRPDGHWACANGLDDGVNRLELIGSNQTASNGLTAKFLLQYDLDVDPIEFLATEAEVKARIGKLLGDSGVKRGSFRVFELKRELSVEISCTEGILPTPFKKYAVSLKGTGRGRPRKRRRGRPRKDS